MSETIEHTPTQCDVCNLVDTDPKHHIAYGPSKHFDCCRNTGCPGQSCHQVPDHLRGEDLRQHIISVGGA